MQFVATFQAVTLPLTGEEFLTIVQFHIVVAPLTPDAAPPSAEAVLPYKRQL